MIKPLWKFLVLFVFLSASLSLEIVAAQEIQIKLIAVKGNQRIDQMTILSKLEVKEGDVFSPEKVQADIKVLNQMGYFEQVKVMSEGLEGGLALTFQVQEKAFLLDVVFEGNENIEKERLEEAVSVKTQSFLDAKLIASSVKKIVEAYEADAYYSASVIPVVQRLPENRAVLTFLIKEGPQVYIDEITFEGNAVFESKVLQKQMETGSYFWLTSWLTESGRYKKEQLAFDRERLKGYYLDHGYLDADVGEPKVVLSEDKEKFTISIPVVEGQQFTVGEMSFDGGQLFEVEELAALPTMKAGEIFSRSTLRADIAAISEHYGEQGYIYADVIPDLRPNMETRIVDLFFRVIEGEKVKIREIHISGNNKTRDKVIRREIRLSEQETVNTKALRRSFQRINNLNFFETFNLVPRRVEPGWVDLDVEVKEKPTGTFSVGGGYSSQDRFIATVDVTMGNFLGKGQLLKFRGEIGGRRDTYSITFKEPYLFDKEISGTVDIFNQRRRFGLYDENRRGGSLIIGKAFGEYARGSVSYTLENLEILNLNTVSEPRVDAEGEPVLVDGVEARDLKIDRNIPRSIRLQAELGKTLTSALGFSLSYDTRDFIFDPSSGGRHSLSYKYAGKVLGGSNAYYKTIYDASRFFPLWWDHVFSAHGRIGFAEGIDGKALPVGERFFVGGINSVRGFEFGKAGPISDSFRDPLGGNKQAYANIEYLIPIVKEAKLKFLLFYDYGAGFGASQRFNLKALRQSWGFGIRWVSPLGPLRLEWGEKLDRKLELNESASQFEFAIGSLF